MNSFCKDGLNKKARSGNLDFEGLQDVYLNFLSEMTKQLSSPNMNLPSDHTKGVIRNEEYENLKVSLEATQLRLEEEKARNKLLEERLRLQDMQEENFKKHALELERKENIIAYAQELNADMAENMSKTETTIVELHAHYKGIVVSLENQLNDAQMDLACLEIEVVQAVKALAAKEAENGKLMHQVEKSEMEIKSLKEFEKRYKLTKSKLCDAEYELKQREEALERLANHLAATVEGNLCENSLEAAGQFLVSLKWNEKR